MKHFPFLLVILPAFVLGQSIMSLNMRFKYDPDNEVSFVLKPVKQGNGVSVFFELKTRHASYLPKNYSITWEKRDSYSQRDVHVLTPQVTESIDSTVRKGVIIFDMPEKSWLLLAKVRNNETGDNWSYYTTIDPKFPVNGYLQEKSEVILNPFVSINKEYTFNGSGSDKPLYVFFYKEFFPAGSPAFAEKDAKVDRFMFHDSSFVSSSGITLQIKKEGLYLVQEDTNSAEGFTFRVVSQSYPKYTRLQDLADPLIFITTKEEHDQLLDAKEEKAKFDKVILDITGSKERAKNFMKSYFKRVELANYYFSSYKEGWKTDRGMIYMIFGLPDEISRNENSEIWNYKGLQTKFTFVKSGSVYDPEAFVLLRDKRFTEKWYYTIDLWRKSRF